jgi:hypothetical protein
MRGSELELLLSINEASVHVVLRVMNLPHTLGELCPADQRVCEMPAYSFHCSESIEMFIYPPECLCKDEVIQNYLWRLWESIEDLGIKEL